MEVEQLIRSLGRLLKHCLGGEWLNLSDKGYQGGLKWLMLPQLGAFSTKIRGLRGLYFQIDLQITMSYANITHTVHRKLK